MSMRGREALHDVRECSGGPPEKNLQWTRVPPKCPGVVRRPSRMSGSYWEALPDVQEALLDVREALPDIREWSGGPPGCPEGSSECP